MKIALKTKNMKRKLKYSVMQSDVNSFVGDVVLTSDNVAYRDEDSIKDSKLISVCEIGFKFANVLNSCMENESSAHANGAGNSFQTFSNKQ